MTHPLARVMAENDRFVLIGDSSEERFPATSYAAYRRAGKPFYCLDLGGLTESRGRDPGHKVYTSVADLPEDRSTLAIIWMKPRSAVRGVELAHEAGCTKVWFSFKTGHASAVDKARELGMEVVEIGRCPVMYVDGALPMDCKGHILWAKGTGLYGKDPQTDASAKRRELI